MKTRDLLAMALSSLGANKLRSGLTTLGITIGVFSVISVMTAISVLQGSIENGLSFLGSNIFQLSKYPANLHGPSDIFKNRPDITYDQALRFRALMQGEASAVCFKAWEHSGVAFYDGQKTNPTIDICGTNEAFLVANSFTIDRGRMLNDSDIELARPVCVIGQAIIDRLFPRVDPIGKVLRLSGHNYVVVGTFAKKGSSFGGSEDGMTAIPVTRWFADFGKVGRSLNLAIQSTSQATYQRTLDHAIGAFRTVRGLQVEDHNDFEIYSNDSLTAAFTSIASTVRIGAFVISAIALLAAGVGIMNIMLVSVTERTKEIGIRKSIGARPKVILRQFLLEAVFLSELGGLLGIVLGILGGNAAALVFKSPMVFPWGWALTGLFVCSAIGIGFGIYPARKAAGLNPIEALRFE